MVVYHRLRQYLKRFRVLVRVRRALIRAWAPAKIVLNMVKDIYDSYLSNSIEPIMTPYGFKLMGSRSVYHVAMQRGEFEPEETALFQQELQRADVFVDVGANIGFFSCLAKAAGKYVIAVEPVPRNIEHLSANVLANAWEDIEIVPAGLSDHPGEATLYGPSSTGATLMRRWAGASSCFKRTIQLSTLDILIGNRFSGKKLFIKIDVEGFEYSVLLGAAAVMKMNPKPTWVIEICLRDYHPNWVNPNFQKTFDLFWLHGYEVFTANRDSTRITREDVARWVECGECGSGTVNYRFVPLVAP